MVDSSSPTAACSPTRANSYLPSCWDSIFEQTDISTKINELSHDDDNNNDDENEKEKENSAQAQQLLLAQTHLRTLNGENNPPLALPI